MEHSIVRELIGAAKQRECTDVERALLAMDALPVPWAWDGCFGVLASGEVVYVDAEAKPLPIERLPDPKSQQLATLVYAARRNSQLSCLLPQRPSNAPVCSACGGKGTVTKIDVLCGECIGLGWTHAA